MIIEAFAEYIKKNKNEKEAQNILIEWLKDILSREPHNNTERAIHKEIAIEKIEDKYQIKGKSQTGNILIESLYRYTISYENQKFSRWLHKIKASDFKNKI